MRRVDQRLLWMGHAGDARDFRSLFEHEIEAVVQLAWDEPIPQAPRELIWARIPLLDGSGNPPHRIQLAVSTLAQLLTQHVPTLVCCSQGLSRTPVIVALALAQLERVSPQKALLALRESGKLDVTPALWHEAVNVYKITSEGSTES